MPVYKDKLRNTWYTRFYANNIYGERKQKTKSGFKTKSEALQYEKNFNNHYINKTCNITFQELYEIYMKDKSQSLKFQSIRSIKSKFKLHILPYFSNYKIDKINNAAYIDWKEKILKKNFSYKYNSGLHGCMVSILNYAIEFYGLDNNIASRVGNFSKKNFIRKINYWTFEEYNQFISKVDNNIYYALFRVLFFTGMRLGECLALTWNDLKENKIDINKTLSKEKKNDNYVISTPKTNSSIRQILIDKGTLKILTELKEFYQNYSEFNNEWFIFGGLKPLSQSTIGRKKNEYCKLANVKQIKIHDFRHSHASIMVSQGVPITALAKRLGHSDTNMTLNTYSHFIPTDEDKAINFLEKLDSN